MSRKYYSLFLFLTFLYLLELYLLPPDPKILTRYNITAGQLMLINTALLIPILCIWIASFYGFIKFKVYAELIKDDHDGKAMNTIANGLGFLAMSFPINGIFDVLLTYLGRVNQDLLPAMTIASNYLSIIVVGASFIVIQQGALQLKKLIKNHQSTRVWIIRIVTLLIGVIYTYLTLQNPLRTTPGEDGIALYYFPDILIILTIAIPTVYVWYAGIEASYNIQLYKENVKGVIYKEALKFLSFGIGAVIVSSILLQILNTFSTWLLELELGALIELLYVLIICIAIGFILIVIGARKLKKIEEI